LQRVGTVVERCHDSEVAPATSDRPEQVRVASLAHREHLTRGPHDLARDEIVDRHGVLAHDPPNTTTQSETGDAVVEMIPPVVANS
jgi:hypothetical protein